MPASKVLAKQAAPLPSLPRSVTDGAARWAAAGEGAKPWV
jgi:hypothetical protein